MITAITVLVVLLSIALLLWSPLIVRIDTTIPELLIQWRGIATCSLTYQDQHGYIYLRTWLFRRRWTLGAPAADRPRRRQKTPSRVRRRRNPMPVRKVIQVLKSFRIIQMELALDTSDVTLNAQLYPLNFFPYPSGKHIYINFLGKNYLLLHTRNTLWRMLRYWFSS